jgi:phosphoribosylglycinamide formyltransferase-1
LTRKRVAIMISGRGSNMASLIDAAAAPGFPAEVVAVVSDQPHAPGLALAADRGLATRIVPRDGFGSRDAHDQAIDATLHGFATDIICLAGYMRLLSPRFVEEWKGRMINIHPSLLPLFKGLDTHARALDAGVRVHGCTVHYVTPEVDDGPIIAQAAVPVLGGDTPETLAARVLKAEHRLYPRALALVATGRATMRDGRAVLRDDGPANPDTVLWSLDPTPRGETDVDVQALARFTP